MNVSKKVLVIIYVIFALLTSVALFSSYAITYSSYSSLENNENEANANNIGHILDLQTEQLDRANCFLSTREDIRTFMRTQDPEVLNEAEFSNDFSQGFYDFIYFVDNSGKIIYHNTSDNTSNLNSSDNSSTLYATIPESKNKNSLLNQPEYPTKGFSQIGNKPVIISSQPVFATPDSEEVLGKIILGKNLDQNFIGMMEKVTKKPISFNNTNDVPPRLEKDFLENKNRGFISDPEQNGKIVGFVVEGINGNPVGMINIESSGNIPDELRKSLQYVALFLLFAGLIIGAACKYFLDIEIVSRIVAIDAYVNRIGKNEGSTKRLIISGNDELSRLTDRINLMLDRLKMSADRLKAEEHEKKIILNALSEFVIFIDLQLKIVWANKASLDYIGLELEKVIGRDYEKVFVMLDESSGKSFPKKALESGSGVSGEVATPDGKVWLVSANLIRDEEGKATGILQTGLDISVHKRSEEKLLHAKLEAEAASRTKSEFLANMSHELRTPLNSIIGFSDILLEQVFGELNERQLKYVNNISTSGKHLLELINDILDLSKVEAGKMELHYSEFSMDAVFEEAKAVLTPLAQDKSLEIEFCIEAVSTLEADRSRLIQILYNLVSNAIKFTPEGGKVLVNCAKSGSRVLISVIDTGIGISPEDQRKLFQPFTQLDASSSRQYCGTGLGLALVKKIVNLHQGEIWVESDVGKGSTFIFALPLIKPPENKKSRDLKFENVVLEFELNKAEALSVKDVIKAPEEVLQLPEIHYSEKEDAHQELVLIVEDDKNSSELLSIVLREEGYSVASISGGKSVLEIAKKLKPEIITLDIFLPDINGWLVLHQLKNDPETASIPVLIISMTNYNELGLSLGATYCFTKPVKRVELITSLRAITSKFELKNPKALIIDDDENTVELISSMLEPEGFETIKAYSGREGIEKLFSEKKPDILILDLIMPEISGFDVISSLRADENTKNLPLIVCTSGEFTEKNIDELNNELKGYLISILKKGTFGRKELINKIKQLAMLKRRNNERDSNC